MVTEATILNYLEEVNDPEVPVLNVLDLGIVRNISIENDAVSIDITPTYSGCPAMNTIATQIKFTLLSYGIDKVTVKEVLSPAWTTDWMSERGKEKLKQYGIAPPQYKASEDPFNEKKVTCPFCGSDQTVQLSLYGSTSCKAMYKCEMCLETFDYFKCH